MIIRKISCLIVLGCILTSTASGQVSQTLGPSPINNAGNAFAGRISALVTSPSDPNRYYAASADGGVWRTLNGGASWEPMTDDMPTTAMGSLALDPNNENIIYAGTGESNYANHSRYGLGIYKSTDGGDRWVQLAEQSFAGRAISQLIVNPDNSNVIYASVTRAGGFPELAAAKGHPQATGPLGVFRSDDAGVTWQQLAGLPNLSVGSLAMDPNNSQVLYAGVGRIFGNADNGIYRSEDGGTSWNRIFTADLPATDIGRVTVTTSPDSNRLYSMFTGAANAFGGGANLLGVYRSDDGGATWVNTGTPVNQFTFGWYFATLKTDRNNPDIVYAGGVTMARSTDAGANWVEITPPHVDIHAVTQDAQGRLMSGGDGGVHRSPDSGEFWEPLNGGLSNIQFYAGISVDLQRADTVIGGTQDNGSLLSDELDLEWAHLLGGDGGWTQLDPTNEDTYYMEFQGLSNVARVSQGSFAFLDPFDQLRGRTAFLAPYLVDVRNPFRILYATQHISETLNGGQTWQQISVDLTDGTGAIRAMAQAPSDPNFIYVATNDGNVQRSEDGGRTFVQIADDVPGWPRVTRELFVSPVDPLRVYLAVSNFGVDQIRRSEDGGTTWESLDANFPDIPVNALLVDPRPANMRDGIIYAGADDGLYISLDDGSTWSRYGEGLPPVPVIDIRLDETAGKLVVATQGRGLWVFQDVLSAGNPSFPADEMTNAWVVDGTQRQGILSSVLVNPASPETPLTDFSSMFTYDTQGNPIWFVMQGPIPPSGDEYQLPVLLPTGDLGDGGRPLTAIGLVTKSRIRDENGAILSGRLRYQFDMSESAKAALETLLAGTGLYDEAAFDNSPLVGIQRDVVANSIIPGGQRIQTFCDINGQVLAAADETAEGRLNLTFERDGQRNLFGAEFTYVKQVDNGEAVPVLDEAGLATPTWLIYDNFSSGGTGLNGSGTSTNSVFSPNGGTAFLEETATDPGIAPQGQENTQVVDANGGVGVQVNKPDDTSEILTLVANSGFCSGFVSPNQPN